MHIHKWGRWEEITVRVHRKDGTFYRITQQQRNCARCNKSRTKEI